GALAALLTLACDSLNEIEIVEVEDGDKAMQQLKTDSFDLLLTDIEMPGKSGLELSQWLQQQRSQTKVIILTTFGRAGYIKRALE
ncbi:response regulator, partial [Psychrobacter sp. HY3-MNA-CIBAN-0198]